MKRFAMVLGGALAAAALAVAPAFSARQVGVPNYHPGGDHVDVAMQVQTIATPTVSSLGYTATNPGAFTNVFAPKQAITFRMWAVDTSNGQVLTAADVRSVFITIPNQPNLKLKWGKLGTTATAPSYWYGTWTVPADYKLGPVAFKALLRTKVGYKLGVFSQDTLAAGSVLQIVTTP